MAPARAKASQRTARLRQRRSAVQSSAPAYLFLDTNIFLHFRRPDEIDWRTLVEGAEVEIVLALSVVREIDNQKAVNPVKRLRKRAAEALKWIDSLHLRPGEPARQLRDGVGLSLLRRDPKIDGSRGLRTALPDDWLIASVLGFRAKGRRVTVLLVTDDLGMRLKAEGYGIDCRKPPDKDRLPDEADPAEAELRKVKAELTALQRRQPVLTVSFVDREERQTVALPSVQLISDADVTRELLAAELQAQRRRPLLLGDDDDEAGLGYSSDDALEAVMDAVTARREYMLALKAARDLRSRTVSIVLLVANTGSAPATDIDLRLEVDDANATLSKSAGEDPADPDAPDATAIAEPHGEHELAPTTILGRGATYHLDRLKQHAAVRLAAVNVAFRARESAGSFGIDFTITFAEGSDQIGGRLDVIT